MARARNVKPSLFKNELLGESDPLLTLLFISLWTLADKSGRLEDRPARIKAETFPYRENIDINGYLTQLVSLGFIWRYEIEGKHYIQVIEFVKHQSPHSTEKSSTIPECPIEYRNKSATYMIVSLNNASTSVNSHINVLIPDSLIPDNSDTNVSLVCNEIADCPHEKIIKLYEKNLPQLTQISKWTANRSKLLKTRWREDKKRQSLEWWDRFFVYISKSKFLTGAENTGRQWQADIDWILKESNFTKIIEGKYHGTL